MNEMTVRGLGYLAPQKLSDGRWAGVQPMLFTAGLFVGITPLGHEKRYCYARMSDALVALRAWDGVGDPPGPWIKEKPSDRLGPGATG